MISTLNALGLVSSLVILACYWISARRDEARIFHQANALLWVPVAVPSALAGVWGATLLTTSFGLIGTYALVAEARETRESMRTWKAIDAWTGE